MADNDNDGKLLEAIRINDVSKIRSIIYENRKEIDFNNIEIPLCALREDNLALLSCLLDLGYNVNATDWFNRTLLHYVARNGNPQCIRLLLEAKKCNINAQNNHGQTPLHVAARCLNIGGLLHLIRFRADVKIKDNKGYSFLHLIARYPDLSSFNDRIHSFSLDEINEPVRCGKTPLMLASKSGNLSVIEILCEQGAFINASVKTYKKRGQTAFHYAAMKGRVDCLRYLKEAGCAVNAITNYGRTALHLATIRHHRNAVDYLVKCNVDETVRDAYRTTPLCYATAAGNTPIVSLLVKNGRALDSMNNCDETAMHIAVRNKYYDCIEILHKAGASLNRTGNLLFGALHVAVLIEGRRLKDIENLLRLGCDVNDRDVHGRTPLHLAATMGEFIILQALLNADASLEMTSNLNETALMMAIYNKNTFLFNLILQKNNAYNYVNARDIDGRTAFYRAIMVDRVNKQILQPLVNAGADVNLPNFRQNTPLLIASRDGKEEIVDFLIAQNANLLFSNWRQRTPLMEAARELRLPVVQRLLASNPSPAHVNLRDGNGETALMLACKHGLIHDLANVISLRLSDSIRNGPPRPHYNPNCPRDAIVKALIEAGADVNLGNNYSISPFAMAVVNNLANIIKMLIRANCDINAPLSNQGCRTAFMFALDTGIVYLLKMLYIADVDAPDIELDDEDDMVLIEAVELIRYKAGHPKTLKEISRSVIRKKINVENLTTMQCIKQFELPLSLEEFMNYSEFNEI